MLTSAQIRGARGFLNISQVELAKETGVSLNTVYRLESDDDSIEKASGSTLKKIKGFFENKGIVFLLSPKDGDGSGEGVRFFSKPKNQD